MPILLCSPGSTRPPRELPDRPSAGAESAAPELCSPIERLSPSLRAVRAARGATITAAAAVTIAFVSTHARDREEPGPWLFVLCVTLWLAAAAVHRLVPAPTARRR